MPEDKNIDDLFFCGGLAIFCAVVNSVIFVLLTGCDTGILPVVTASMVFVAPLVEEYAKRIAVVRGIPWMFLLVFCCVETLFIARNAGAAGIAARIVPCLMHASTVAVQWWTHKRALDKKEPATSALGFLVAFLIHAVYNATVVFLMMRTCAF